MENLQILWKEEQNGGNIVETYGQMQHDAETDPKQLAPNANNMQKDAKRVLSQVLRWNAQRRHEDTKTQ